MKFVVILRSPIERAFSQWNMQRSRGNETFDFLQAVEAEPRRIADAAPKQLRKFSYVDRGRYADQLERAFRLFPREQFLVIKYRDFPRPAAQNGGGRFSFPELKARAISYGGSSRYPVCAPDSRRRTSGGPGNFEERYRPHRSAPRLGLL